MSASSQELLKSFDFLPEPEKREVASEIIRRTFVLNRKIECDAAQLADLYADFADEDRALAEEGVENYERGLVSDQTMAKIESRVLFTTGIRWESF
jgi:hypothetical protein